MVKRLLLLGGGHAHVDFLAGMAAHRLKSWEVHLIAPTTRQIYSKMLPGWIAGDYPLSACTFSLAKLCERAGVVQHETQEAAVDMAKRLVYCADGSVHWFDALSIDPMRLPFISEPVGQITHALHSHLSEHFISRWSLLVDRMLSKCRRFHLVVLGADTAGVELVLAIHRRAVVEGWSHLYLTLVGSEDLPLAGANLAARRHAAKLLSQRCIQWQGNCKPWELGEGRLTVNQQPTIDFHACIVAANFPSLDWPMHSGLTTDRQGQIVVGSTLQSASHPHVFACGETASYSSCKHDVESCAALSCGALSEKLRAYCEGRQPKNWAPSKQTLQVIGTGGGRAMASFAGWSWSSPWLWRWKDCANRRYLRKLS